MEELKRLRVNQEGNVFRDTSKSRVFPHQRQRGTEKQDDVFDGMGFLKDTDINQDKCLCPYYYMKGGEAKPV